MSGKEYADKHYLGYPTYQRIAQLAFIEGKKKAVPDDVVKLKEELKKAKQELAELWKTIECPGAFAELVAGL